MGMNNDVFEARCKEIVRDYFNSHADKSKSGCYIGLDDVYVVWMVRVLGNNKALLSTNVTDGMYYEITRNGQTGEFCVDAYKKWENFSVAGVEKEGT